MADSQNMVSSKASESLDLMVSGEVFNRQKITNESALNISVPAHFCRDLHGIWLYYTMLLKVTSSIACAEIVNKTINHTFYLAIITQYIMTAKQKHKDYSCLILKDLRPSELVSLYNICAGTDHE